MSRAVLIKKKFTFSEFVCLSLEKKGGGKKQPSQVSESFVAVLFFLAIVYKISAR
jgi:hypothetical protein